MERNRKSKRSSSRPARGQSNKRIITNKPKNRSSSQAGGLVRLNKAIADSGLCSRRKADELIDSGSVTVNGRRVYELGVKVDLSKDSVKVSGKVISAPSEFVYYMVNKPKNVVTTMDDPLDRPKISDIITTEKQRIFPVGRLDWDSEGLIIMTNDGEFANQVTHPKEEITKTYLVKLDGQPDDKQLQRLKKGVTIVGGGKVSAKHIERVNRGSSSKYDWVKIVITEGKNRQIRKMFEKIGFDVTKLQRVSIGLLTMGKLKKGDFKKLGPKDLEKVFQTIDHESVEKRKKSHAAQARSRVTKTIGKAGVRKRLGKPGSRSASKKKRTSR